VSVENHLPIWKATAQTQLCGCNKKNAWENFRELGMTEFAQDLRHHCRNPRCRMKLKEPVGNPRDAFCTKGCHSSFYLHRCVACEQPFKRRQENQRICRKPRCRNDWQAGVVRSRYLVSSSVKLASKTPDFIGLKRADKRDRPPHIPDGPNCTWEGGEYRRLEAKNRAALREHFRELAKQCLIQPHHPPVNVLGGYRFPGAPTIDLSPLPADDTVKRSDWKPRSPGSDRGRCQHPRLPQTRAGGRL
jgi:hypothetical protein